VRALEVEEHERVNRRRRHRFCGCGVVSRLAAVVLLAAWLGGCARRAAERTRAAAPAAGERSAPPAEQAQKPNGPPVRLFAASFVVKVRSEPLRAAPRIGYLRGGAVVQATSAEPVGYDKCRKGWYGLDTGGFVCSTLAFAFLGKRLPERQPLQPDLAAPLPYPYGYSLKRNTPVYRRLPSDDEAAQYEGYRIPGRPVVDAGVRIEARSAVDGAIPTESTPDAAHVPAASAAAAPTRPIAGAVAAPEAAGAPGGAEDQDGQDPGVATLASLMGEAGSVLMRRMERGFYVSLDRQLQKGARSYWRTQSNGFIPSRGLREVQGSEFHGVSLKEQGIALPIAFVMSKDDVAYTLTPKGALKPAGKPGYHFMFKVVSEADVRGTHYLVGDDQHYYRPKDVRRIEAREKPAEIGADEKWIDVDLGVQSLVAYVGAEPVYATLISSGRIKDELNPLKNFETPAGAYRIKSKHLTATMDGDHAIDGPYSIEDVPYVMYFQLAYALHSAFWHNAFGRPHSHGCINLAPLDAKWLFEFAEPPLPKAWHGVYPTTAAPGTRLYIHGETPQG
jgi:hypothetical protein